MENQSCQDFWWNSNRWEKFRRSPSMASCIKSDKEPGTWGSRTGWHTDSWFLSILGLQRQSTSIFQSAHIVFPAPQVPKHLQTGYHCSILRSSQDDETKEDRRSASLEANTASSLRNLVLAQRFLSCGILWKGRYSRNSAINSWTAEFVSLIKVKNWDFASDQNNKNIKHLKFPR